jgi:hypothetical protein
VGTPIVSAALTTVLAVAPMMLCTIQVMPTSDHWHLLFGPLASSDVHPYLLQQGYVYIA